MEESKFSDETMEKAFDLMTKAGWTNGYVRTKRPEIRVAYTVKGKMMLGVLRQLLEELDLKELDRDAWYFIAFIAALGDYGAVADPPGPF